MSKPMRAKMYVTSVTPTDYSDIVEFMGVYGGSTNAEDNSFASSTPGANAKLHIDNPALRGVYQPGDTFYVDFTPVPKPE